MVISITIVIGGAAIPLAYGNAERSRTAGAASYVAGRFAAARLQAVRRSAHVAIRFVQAGDSYVLRTYVDGNRNGVLARDITSGIDTPISSEERLEERFAGVTFGILPEVTSVDPGEPFNPADPIQIGSSTFVSFSPIGSCTSGTVFIRALQRQQFAVRILGATGRTRILRFDFGSRTWQTP